MKCTFTWLFLFLLVLVTGAANAQASFTDDFESYTVGDKVAQKNPTKWRTWENKPGTGQDASVTDTFAMSGKNSIVITGNPVNGGPVDLVLPFTARFTTGTFTYKMNMLIPEGANAYFNFQGEVAVGSSSPLDAFFANGLFEINSGGQRVAFSTYPVNEWFEIAFEINLTANLWKILVNKNCVGAFSSVINRIASIDLYGLNATTLYYVDDVAFGHTTTAATYNVEASITDFSWPTGSLTGTEDSITVGVRNFGNRVISSLDLDFRVNGVSEIVKFSGLTLLKGREIKLKLPNKYKVKEGDNNLAIVISRINNLVGDEEPCNNFRSFVLQGVTPAEFRAVLAEQGTGTWCVWCPRGAVFMDLLTTRYKGRFIPIAVHNRDPMQVTNYNNLITSIPGFIGFPSAVVDRVDVLDPSGLEAPFLNNIAFPTTVKLRTGAVYNETSREVTVDVEAEFLSAIAGDFRMNLVFTEDGVTGTSDGFNQANGFAGGGSGPMGGYESLPNPVPASMMVYDHVGRSILGLTGANSAFRGDFNKGDRKLVTFVYRVPSTFKRDRMNIIPIIFNEGIYQNASISTFSESVAKGLISNVNDVVVIDEISIYPNPTSDLANISISLNALTNVAISVSDITGQVVTARDYGKLEGEYTLPVSLLGFAPGTYFATVKTDFGVTVQKIVVTK